MTNTTIAAPIVDSTDGLTVRAVHIDCNSLKGEIVSVIRHDAVSMRVGDASDNRSEERVTTSQRVLKCYGKTPGAATVGLARAVRDYALRTFPGVPVELYGA